MKFIKWLAVSISCWTMSIAPLAQGAEAQRNNMLMAEEMVKVIGLTGPEKVKTVGELWDRVKLNFPEVMRKQIEPSVLVYKNETLPTVQLQAMDGANKNFVKMLLTKGKETLTIELMEDEAKLVKVNGVALSAYDIWYGGMFEKLMAIPTFKESSNKKKNELLGASIIPSYEQFKNMTQVDRAYYLVHLRMLLQDADSVQSLYDTDGTKTSSVDKLDKYEALLKWLVGDEAMAASNTGKKTKGSSKATPSTATVSTIPKAKATVGDDEANCVVAGYLSRYVSDSKGTYCSHEQIKLENPALKNNFNNAQKVCGKTAIACNPLVYGYRNDSLIPACITISRTPKNSEFQQATSECDKKLPLKNSKDAANMVRSLLLEKGKSKSEVDALFDKDKLKSKEAYDQIMKEIVSPTEAFINKAIDKCTETPGKKHKDSNQLSACEALANRKGQLEALLKNFDIANPVLATAGAEEKAVECATKEKPAKSVKPAATKEKETCPVSPMQAGLPDGDMKPQGSPSSTTASADNVSSSTPNMGGNAAPPASKSSSFNFWPVLGILGLIGIGAYFLFGRSHKKSKSPTYVAPVAVCPTGNTSLSCTATDPVTVTVPSPISTKVEGGTGVNTGISTGGVR